MEKNQEVSDNTLEIETKSWQKDTEDLFDFEAKDVIKNSFKVTPANRKNFLVSKNDNLSLIKSIQDLNVQLTENANSQENFQIITQITYMPKKKRGSYIIENPMISKELHCQLLNKQYLSRTWKISPKDVQTEIKVGDIIKLGRVRLKFDKICFKNTEENMNNTRAYYLNISHLNSFNPPSSNNSNNNLNNNNNNNNNNNQSNNNINLNNANRNNSNMNLNFCNGNTITNVNNNSVCEKDLVFDNNSNDNNINDNNNNIYGSEEKKVMCRICYCSDSDKANPLISPCKCSGSMKYIHYKCLKNCIKSKLNTKEEENYKFLTWKSFECEICKEEYPKYLKYKKNYFSLVDLDINFSEYCICDYSIYDDNRKKTFRRGILIFKINDEIPIGRTQSNMIKLKDISVSRAHCNIIKKNNKLYIVDKGSKFGTLIYVNDQIAIDNNSYNNNLDLISGKHCFNIKLIYNKCFFSKFLFFNINCCECNHTNDKDYVVDLDKIDNNNNNNINNNNTNNASNFPEVNSKCFPCLQKDQRFDESYDDFILDIGSIIINGDSHRDK